MRTINVTIDNVFYIIGTTSATILEIYHQTLGQVIWGWGIEIAIAIIFSEGKSMFD